MSNRTIKAPGVEIFEHDMSEYPSISEGTHVLIAGFAQKGEDYEPYRLTSRSSWLKFYGAPTNEAEEYFYNAANAVIDQGGYLHSVKIPYSNDIKGIYAAAKFRIEECYDLLERNESGDYFVNLDGTPNTEINNGTDAARLMDQYKGLKQLGINSISKIAPQAQDFLSYDLVEEYEAGESKPSSNTIYIVDKTRAIYTRAVKVDDVQSNRDARSCIGIIPVISTRANTAWFQKQSTGLTSPINELYQPVRGLKTITFPAGAASAAEYQPTEFKPSDLTIDLIKEEGSYDRSLSEMAAMQAQSCLVNGNMVDGKFAPDACNEVAVIVFKAYVSTEDSKIDFDVVEQWTGSLDPDARDDKGVSTYIGTKINNNSDYIYFFSNLKDPKTVCKMDHAFVAGSNSSFSEIEEKIKEDDEYIASQTFGGYTARMLGFDDNDDDETYEQHTIGSLRSFYNQNDKEKVAVTDTIVTGEKLNYEEATADCGDTEDEQANVGTVIHGDVLKKAFENKRILTTDKYITRKPSCIYKIGKKAASEMEEGKNANWYGKIDFSITSPESALTDDGKEFIRIFDKDRAAYVPEVYEKKLLVGRMSDPASRTVDELIARGEVVTDDAIGQPYEDVELAEYELPDSFQDEKLFQLSIFNSTDYIRSIEDFEDLVNVASCAETLGIQNPDEPDGMNELRDRMIRLLIVNSMEKTAKYKVYLRKLKKAQAAIDRLDDEMATFVKGTTAKEFGPYTSRIYVRDLYNSLSHMGLLNGITIVDETTPSVDSSSSSAVAGISKLDAVEARIENLINPDTSKKEKAEPKAAKKSVGKRESSDPVQAIVDQLRHYNEKGGLDWDYPTWYIKCRVYLKHKLFECYKDMYTFLTDTFDDCAMAADRYLQTQQSIDDKSIMLGFYPEMAEPIITYTEIAQSLNKMFDTFGDVNSTTIDVVCDAGLSNIAQFVKQVYDPSSDDGEDVGGCYEPVRNSSYFKFNKNTDLSYWKTIIFKYNTLCKSIRKDCMFIADGPRHLVLNGNKQIVRKSKKDTSVDINILPYLTKLTGFNTSYGAGYINWYKTISDYTGDILWVPPSIIAAGTYVLTDRDYNWWDAPAGQKRGAVDMADVSFNPTNKQAGEIYDVAWNYAVNYQGNYINGIIQEGQKTFQSYQSAFDRVNVRRLFLRCERYVYFASRAFLYEPNTAYTRQRYVDTIEPFFDDIKQRGGMYDYKIICDDSNNTPDTIDRNELRTKIGIQPTKTVEFILVDFVASRTGSDWFELDAI